MFTLNDFFCGAGGMGLGFKQAGFDIKGAWDFDKYAVESYRHNVGDHVLKADISKMDFMDLPFTDVWTFGFPCQDLSVAGKQAGMIKGQTRSGLFFEIMRLLAEVRNELSFESLPKVIMAENVKGLKPYLGVLKEEYEAAGYKMYHNLYNSKYWGVPQNRERYFVVGIREDIPKEFTFPEQQTDYIPKLSSVLEENVDEKHYISDEKAAKIITQAKEGLRVKQATKLGYDVAVEGDSINISHPNSKTRRGRVGKQVAQTLLTGQEQVVVESLGPIVAANLNHYGNDQMNRVYSPEGISPTALVVSGGGREIKILEELQSVFTDKDGAAYCCDANYAKGISPGDVGNGRRTQIVEYTEPTYRVRKLTPREYARLQGFPDSYEQVVSNSQFYKQMGNAVTVNVAEAIATAIKDFLKEV